tara:strand:+ start:412 stop:897 length:486 start_codon:yes stop_codon:yes gene_type:complete
MAKDLDNTNNNKIIMNFETPNLTPGSKVLQNTIDGPLGTLFKNTSNQFGVNSEGEKYAKSVFGPLEKTYNFDTKETTSSITLPNPILPFISKTVDLDFNKDAGVTTSLNIPFTGISVDHKEKYDSSFYANFVAMQTGNPFAGMLSKSILDGNDIFGLNKNK